MNIKVTTENLGFFQCFSSEKKLRIIELLNDGPKNIGELANLLGVSSTIVTRHIRALEEAGVVQFNLSPGKRGLQKICSLAVKEVLLSFNSREESRNNQHTIELNIGDYAAYDVEPTCGLASEDNYIGLIDDARYFSNPKRRMSKLIWFQSGYIEYHIPSYEFDRNKNMKSINFSLELGSEYPGYKDEYPSDIYFHINDVLMGFWTSPGNFGSKKGLYTPEWFTCGTQFGLLKNLTIKTDGTYIDGNKISEVNINDIGINNKDNLSFKISSPKTANHPGGVTIFGKGFGNYDQEIIITLTYDQ